MQDIARIDGWVKVDRPEPLLPEFEFEVPDEDSSDSDSAEPDSDFAEPHTDFAELKSDSKEATGSQQPTTDSSGMITYDHTPASEQIPEVVESLPDDVLEYNSSPISQGAVPILPLDLQAESGDDYENLGSEYVQAESQLVGTESEEADLVSGSDDVDSISTDADEEDESSLLLADVSPQELCMYGCLAPTVWLFAFVIVSAQGSMHCLSVMPGHMLGCCIIFIIIVQVTAIVSLQYLHSWCDAYTSHVLESLCPYQGLHHMHALGIHTSYV